MKRGKVCFKTFLDIVLFNFTKKNWITFSHCQQRYHHLLLTMSCFQLILTCFLHEYWLPKIKWKASKIALIVSWLRFQLRFWMALVFVKHKNLNFISCINLDKTLFPLKMTVIDGGYLLHRHVWHQSETFKCIWQKNLNSFQAHKPWWVVFDGYPTANSTQFYERSRSSSKHTSASMLFLSEDKVCEFSKEDFLSNIDNKKLLANRLTQILSEHEDINVYNVDEDADILTITTAIEKAIEF